MVEGLVLINVNPCAEGWMDWAATKVNIASFLKPVNSSMQYQALLKHSFGLFWPIVLKHWESLLPSTAYLSSDKHFKRSWGSEYSFRTCWCWSGTLMPISFYGHCTCVHHPEVYNVWTVLGLFKRCVSLPYLCWWHDGNKIYWLWELLFLDCDWSLCSGVNDSQHHDCDILVCLESDISNVHEEAPLTILVSVLNQGVVLLADSWWIGIWI